VKPEDAYLYVDTVINNNYGKVPQEDMDLYIKTRNQLRAKLPKTFELDLVKNNIKAQEIEAIKKNPEAIFKQSYSMLNDRNILSNPEKLKQLKAYNAVAKAELMKENVDIDDLLKVKTGPSAFFDGLLKAMNVPVNAILVNPVSQVLTGRKVKTWGPNAWEQLVHNWHMKDPVNQKIADKIAAGAPLESWEEKRWKDYKGARTWGGLALNLLPLTGGLAGGMMAKQGLTKGLPALVKAGKAVQKISLFSDPLNVPGHYLGKAKELRKLANTDVAKGTREAINSLAAMVKSDDVIKATGKIDQKSVMKLANQILSKPGAVSADDLKNIRTIKDMYLKAGNKEVGGLIDESLKQMGEFAKTVKGAKAKTGQGLYKAASKYFDVKEGFGKNVGKGVVGLANKIAGASKYVTVGDLPVIRQFNRTFGKGFISPVYNVVRDAKRVTSLYGMKARDIESTMEQLGKEIAKRNGIGADEAKKLVLSMLEDPLEKMKSFIGPDGVKSVDLGKLRTGAAARKGIPATDDIVKAFLEKVPAKHQRKLGDAWGAVKYLDSKYDDILLQEFASGVNTELLGIDKGVSKAIDRFQASYLKRLKGAPDHPNLERMRSAFAQKVKNIRDDKMLLNAKVVVSGGKIPKGMSPKDYLRYSTRVAHPDFLAYLKREGVGNVQELFTEKARYQPELGKALQKPEQVRPFHTSMKKRLDELADMSIGEINALSRKGEAWPRYKGETFIEDPTAAIMARYKRGGWAISEKALENGIKEMMEEIPELFTKNPELARARGWQRILGQGKNVVYGHVDIQRGLDEVHEFIKAPGEMAKFINNVEKLSGYMKAMMTVGRFPAFPLRNLVGNVFLMSLSKTAPEHIIWGYMDAMKILGAKMDKGVLNMAKIKVVAPNGRVFFGEELRNIMAREDLFHSGFISDVLNDLQKLGKPNPSTIDKVIHGATLQPLLKLSGKFNQYFEDVSKAALFIARLRAGDGVATAAATARKYLFDYNDLTRFEKGFVKTVVPFWVWIKKNTAMQLYNLFSMPTRNVLRGAKTLANVDREVVFNEGLLPDYRRDMQAIQTPGLSKDPYMKTKPILSLTSLIPTYDVGSIIPTFDLNTLSSLLGKRNMTEMFNQMHPMIRSAASLITGSDLRTGLPIKAETVEESFQFHANEWMSIMQPIMFAKAWIGYMNKDEFQKTGSGNPNAKATTFYEMALYSLIGKPSRLDERQLKITKEGDVQAKIMEQVNMAGRSIANLKTMYRGDAVPKKVLKEAGARFIRAQRAYNDAVSQGLLANKPYVRNQLVRVGNDILLTSFQYKTQFKERHPEAFKSEKALVDRVIDGDTIEVTVGGKRKTVRFDVYDAPETTINEKLDKEAKFKNLPPAVTRDIILRGLKAKKRLEEMLKTGSIVDLYYTADDAPETYGRIVASVFKDGTNIGKQMSQEGLVDYYQFKGKKKKEGADAGVQVR
jgi:endonuclease YncB( thermonuclease family)